MAEADLERKVRAMLETGVIDPQLIDELRRTDPQQLDRVLSILKDAGAEEVGSGAPLDIGSYYRDAPRKYSLKWPVRPGSPLPMPFDELDRKTQFFVLWNEWSGRELDAMMALNSGDDAKAEKIFAECVERAKQLGVGELLARSYEGHVRVAEKRGDRDAERRWAERAATARRGA